MSNLHGRGEFGSDTFGYGVFGQVIDRYVPPKVNREGISSEQHTLTSEEVAAFTNDGMTRLRVNATSHTTVVFLKFPDYIDEELLPFDKEIEVKAGESKLIGPFPPSLYNNEDGEIEFQVSEAVGVTFELVSIPKS